VNLTFRRPHYPTYFYSHERLTLSSYKALSLPRTNIKVTAATNANSPITMSIPTTYDAPIPIAVIGGTGFYSLPNFTHAATLDIPTPWGAPSSPIIVLEHKTPNNTTLPIAFLSRHGLTHNLTPSEIPVRANIAALRRIGVRIIISFSAAGSLRSHIAPRDFVIPDQAIDRTWGRPSTFFEDGIVCHVPMADPFDATIRNAILATASSFASETGDTQRMHDRGTVVVIPGPAFSTRAESHMYRAWGGDVINMSSFPEAKLAREAEIAFAQIVMSTDYDCWKGEEDVSVEMVMGHMAANLGNAKKLVVKVLDELSKEEYEGARKGDIYGGQRRFGVSTKAEGMGREALERMEWLFPGYFGEGAGRKEV
jgi:5'-methylthioadenosine phosphorylase